MKWYKKTYVKRTVGIIMLYFFLVFLAALSPTVSVTSALIVWGLIIVAVLWVIITLLLLMD